MDDTTSIHVTLTPHLLNSIILQWVGAVSVKCCYVFTFSYIIYQPLEWFVSVQLLELLQGDFSLFHAQCNVAHAVEEVELPLISVNMKAL